MAKLVVIGDSLSQGFSSAAITNTWQSYPALIAEAMGLSDSHFCLPDFFGKGGIPCNIEWLARRLEEVFGHDLNAFDWLRSIYKIPDLLDEVEDFWERGKGSAPSAPKDYHNLAIFGWEVADAMGLDAGRCRLEFERSQRDDMVGIPSESRLRTGYRVLNPAHDAGRDADTQISIAERIHAEQGGIENLIVFLGANNALGTVVDLEIVETGDASPGPLSKCTLWSQKAFEVEYSDLARRIDAINPTRVFVGTVPHVTVPPITRGVMKNRGRLPEDQKYFDFYTRFWIHDKEFNPGRDPYLTGAEARRIDDRIDAYNRVIRTLADNRPNWHVVDISDLLDTLAVRRNHGSPSYRLPPAFSDLSIRFLEINPGGGIKRGGLIGLDGVHPTYCGYSLMARAFIEAMQGAGVAMRRGFSAIDFAEVRLWDTLVSRPPRTLDDMFGALAVLERHFHLSRWISSRK